MHNKPREIPSADSFSTTIRPADPSQTYFSTGPSLEQKLLTTFQEVNEFLSSQNTMNELTTQRKKLILQHLTLITNTIKLSREQTTTSDYIFSKSADVLPKTTPRVADQYKFNKKRKRFHKNRMNTKMFKHADVRSNCVLSLRPNFDEPVPVVPTKTTTIVLGFNTSSSTTTLGLYSKVYYQCICNVLLLKLLKYIRNLNCELYLECIMNVSQIGLKCMVLCIDNVSKIYYVKIYYKFECIWNEN